MNGPAPGWQPDPTGRHEYRYWDGTRWSDDVSDGGVASTDPVGGAPEATQPLGATDQVPPTAAQPGYQAGYDPSGYDSGQGAGAPATGYGAGAGSGGYGATGGSAPGGVPSGGYGSGGYPNYGTPSTPPSSGPSTGLLVGLGALVLVLIAGIAFVLLSDDDGDDTATDDPSTTTTGDTTDSTDTTTTTAPPDDGGGDGGSSDAIVTSMAEAIVAGSDGQITQEQAECMSQAMIDELGLDRLVELGLEASNGTGDPLDSMTDDEQNAVYDAMIPCIGDGGELPPIGGT